jgi:hypothetical protein
MEGWKYLYLAGLSLFMAMFLYIMHLRTEIAFLKLAVSFEETRSTYYEMQFVEMKTLCGLE